ncbi:PTS lactose/cellobiose transporter subunit IIA [Erysipelotrichaceae bacterium 51-3]
MENLELISCQLIAASGTAKSCYIEAIEAAKTGDFEQAEDLIKEGSEAFLQGHSAHASLIQMSAQQDFNVPLLLVHAEDQMMNCEMMKIFAEQNIYLLKENQQLKSAFGRTQ